MPVPESRYLVGQKIARSPGKKPEASGPTGKAYRHQAAFIPIWANRQDE